MLSSIRDMFDGAEVSFLIVSLFCGHNCLGYIRILPHRVAQNVCLCRIENTI